MKKFMLFKMMAIFLLITFLSGFGPVESNKNITSSEKLKKENPKKTLILNRNKAILSPASKIIANMSIKHNSMQTLPEDRVVKDYLAKYKTLPKNPKLIDYKTNLKPGTVVKPGTGMEVGSNIVVVPGKTRKEVFIKERIAIYDSTDKNTVLKTLVKSVNDKTKRAGGFTSRYTFVLPGNMPRGVYPIRTHVIVNGKEANPNTNKMQLVLNVDENRQFKIVRIAD